MAGVLPWWGNHGDASGERWRRRRILLATALAVAALVTALHPMPAWKLLESRAFDYFSTLGAPDRPEDGPIVVAIDEPSLAEIGIQWPWPRSLHGRLVESLRKAGAKVIALDIIFAEPSSEAEDAALASSLGSDVVLAGDETFIDTEQALQHIRVEPLPRFTTSGARVGITSISPDRDGILRRLPSYPDGFAASMLAAADIPADPRDGALLQTFGGARTYPTVSYYQALDPQAFLPEGTLRDRIVLVGLSLQNAPTITDGGADVHATSSTIRTGRLVAGVEIQATVLDNLAHGLAIDRAPTMVAILAILFGAVLGCRVSWRRTGWTTIAVTTLAVAGLLAASYVALRFGRVFVPPVAPALALALVTGIGGALDFAAERRQRRAVTRAFSHYLSPALVERLARDPSQLRLGGEVRTLSVLFCDIRGFTTIAESMKDDPERLTQLINRLLTPLSDVVLGKGGTIDKYIGDCLMAFWNAPLDDPDHALHAVEAALSMETAVAGVNEALQREAQERGEAPIVLRIGIGINTGPCVVGNMGSERRFDYSALGDAVNLASRLEGASKELGVAIVIGAATAELVAGRIALRPLRAISVKGRTEPTLVYTTGDKNGVSPLSAMPSA
jgi:adenylate cyclase